MANPVLEAIRARHDLKESVLHTAQEIAHLASVYGVARASLDFLRKKCHCCKQTIINHINILIERGILRKTVLWIKNNFCAINTYTFILPWNKTTAQTCKSQNFLQKFPHKEEKEKFGTLREEIAALKKGLGYCTEGSTVWEATRAEIKELTARLESGYGEASTAGS